MFWVHYLHITDTIPPTWLIPLLPLLLIDLLDRPQLLLQLHPSVLEPNLDLTLCEAQGVSYFYTSPENKIIFWGKYMNIRCPAHSPPGQVVVEVELLLQLESLEPGVGLPAAPAGTTVRAWN